MSTETAPTLVLEQHRYGEQPPDEYATILCTCGAEIPDCPGRIASRWETEYSGRCVTCGTDLSVTYEWDVEP